MTWPRGRRKPYTVRGIKRLKCIRCGRPGRFQWAICADGNKQRPLCTRCDIALNALVLRWAKCPNATALMRQYKKKMAEGARLELASL